MARKTLQKQHAEQRVKIASVSSAGHWENGKFQEKFNKEKLA